MNAVEIEEAVSTLVEAPFDVAEFPFAFLQAFGLNDAAAAKLKKGDANKSDCGGVLQRAKNNIHIKACAPGDVADTLVELRASPATEKHKARFILATDGQTLQAERFDDGEVLACEYKELPDRFAFFLSLAGISTVKKIDENAFDIRATGRLNKLYVELLRTNPDWDTEARREDLNHFFARLIFCLFAEDTGIFDAPPTWASNPNFGLFTWTVETMTERDGSNCHTVLAELFRAMNTPRTQRAESDLTATACRFPYVNGNLFSGSTDCPRFSQSARNYLLFVGGLDWRLINPDIFGSMIQAVADDEERGALGMHYTSVPNILKVLNPLFLDDLRKKLEEAGDGSTPASKGQLKRLRDRLAKIRVFDPACGSGNFLVIAYKQMREIEAVINERRGERDRPSEISPRNFCGIELRGFAAEVARLALIIAKFQCDVLHISERYACECLLPLQKGNWIIKGNALRLDWLQICPPTGTGVRIAGDALFNTPKDQAEIAFENAGGETYICGNPPYKGSQGQTPEQKEDLKALFAGRTSTWGSIDYVCGWFLKAADYATKTRSAAAFVATNSICQGRQVQTLWPLIFRTGNSITFAHTSFKWANLASHNAGVTVAIIGISTTAETGRRIFSIADNGAVVARDVPHINAYLVPAANIIVKNARDPLSDIPAMTFGNMPNDGGHLLLSSDEADRAIEQNDKIRKFARPFVGSNEFIYGLDRRCIWVNEAESDAASSVPWLRARFDAVEWQRCQSTRKATKDLARLPYRFGEVRQRGDERVIIVPSVSSESREYLPAGYLREGTILSNLAFALLDAPLWALAIITSKLHIVWIATVCGKLETRYRYSNTLGWNTFPAPPLSDQNKSDLTRCAQEILLSREAHFPATIADLYDPDAMPPDLRAAHERNDEVLERIYIGRRFRNDTERLEKLFEMYTAMTDKATMPDKGARAAVKGRKK